MRRAGGSGSGSGGSSSNVNSVFYAETYHPIQAGSIDGTDIAPHDNGVYRALLCSNAALYDPFGDPKVIGDPYCTLYVAHLSHQTTESTLRQAMSRYGRVKNLRLVRHLGKVFSVISCPMMVPIIRVVSFYGVTGASRGYAFVEFETENEMYRAYKCFYLVKLLEFNTSNDAMHIGSQRKRPFCIITKDAHHTIIDDSEIIVDYNRQQLMPGWIPRRLGGGLGGKKESGQLRFGGRERPFRAPLRQVPLDDLKRLGITPPGRYMSRFEIPSPPRRKSSSKTEEVNKHEKRKLERSSSPNYRKNSRRHSELHKQKQSRHSNRFQKRQSSSGPMSPMGREEAHSRHHVDSCGNDRWTSSGDDLFAD